MAYDEDASFFDIPGMSPLQGTIMHKVKQQLRASGIWQHHHKNLAVGWRPYILCNFENSAVVSYLNQVT